MTLAKTLLAGVIVAFAATHVAHADSVEDFYKGKTVNLIIGYSVGGGYDLYGRLLARHIGKYIPGRPNIVPQNLTGAQMKLVTGYHGTNDATLAMERGEVDGVCGLSWSTLKSRHLQWMNEKKINIIIQAALRKQPELASVPLAIELTRDPEKLQILKLLLASQEM